MVALWSLGFSLPKNYHVGVAGVGLGEILFLCYLPILFLDRIFILNLHKTLYELRFFLVVSTIFTMLFSIGTLAGALIFDANSRDIFILLRQFLYFFLLVPILATLTSRVSINFYLNSYLIGVLFSCIFNNAANFKDGFDFFSAFPGQNPLGIQIAIIFPLVIYQFFKKDNGILKVLVNGAIFLIFILSAMLTWSKGAWISVVMSFFLILWMKNFKINSNNYKNKWAVVIFIIMVLAIIFPNISVFSRIFEVEISSSTGSNSNEQRLMAAFASAAIGLKYPFGIGGSNYPLAARQFDIDFFWIMPDPHNAYAHALSWAGIVGFPFFIFLFFYPLWLVLIYKKSKNEYFVLFLGNSSD
jgi:hypothetical protein